MTRRQKIASLIVGYLQEIKTDNGYLTDIGDYVEHWGTKVMPQSGSYSINLKDLSNEYFNNDTEVLNFQIYISCKIATNHLTITNMIQDILNCITSNLDNLSAEIGQLVRFLPGNETIDINNQNDSEKGFATIEFSLQHRYFEKYSVDQTNY